jgi:hypothetical protein
MRVLSHHGAGLAISCRRQPLKKAQVGNANLGREAKLVA